MNLLDILFPRRCVGCRRIGDYFCPQCISSVEFLDTPVCPVCAKPAIDGITHPRCHTPLSLDGMFALAHYRGIIRQAIRLYKYSYISDLTDSLTRLLLTRVPHDMPLFDCVVAVPLATGRERARGFNQSMLLAKAFAAHVSIPVVSGLVRVRETRPQFGLSPQERRKNLLGAFAYEGKISLQGKRIVLIDDVTTTRATFSECTKVLKRAGAKNVWGIALAHG